MLSGLRRVRVAVSESAALAVARQARDQSFAGILTGSRSIQAGVVSEQRVMQEQQLQNRQGRRWT
jgi:hypothetical protein